jgi:hypothetical protein
MADLLFIFRLALAKSEATKTVSEQTLSKDFVPISGPVATTSKIPRRMTE